MYVEIRQSCLNSGTNLNTRSNMVAVTTSYTPYTRLLKKRELESDDTIIRSCALSQTPIINYNSVTYTLEVQILDITSRYATVGQPNDPCVTLTPVNQGNCTKIGCRIS
ncbi:hypothetical protein M758_1G263500 [Ceratodon purpureus]|nr:hypothetical protein M758_1G263500 [Ceratodon purpureus]